MSQNMLGDADILRLAKRGAIRDLLDKLHGKKKEEWKVALRKFLRRESPFKVLAEETPVWKTITVGNFTSVKAIKQALNEGGYPIMQEWTNNAFDDECFTVSTNQRELDLVVLSLRQLGFRQKKDSGGIGTWCAVTKDIYRRAMMRGFELCPAETGPQLRLQYDEQPSFCSDDPKAKVTIAMNSMDVCVLKSIESRSPSIFSIIHNREARVLWLEGHATPNRCWHEDDLFVFVKPRHEWECES